MSKPFTMNSPEKDSEKQNIILYFQVHQPRCPNVEDFFDIPNEPPYFNDNLNESVVRRDAQERQNVKGKYSPSGSWTWSHPSRELYLTHIC